MNSSAAPEKIRHIGRLHLDAGRHTMRNAPPIGFWEAFKFWLKLGFISFGGPAGQIAIMHSELVERRRWISEKRFMHALNYCMVLPGPEAQQLATYIGWLMHRNLGAVVAGLLFVLPSLLILIAISWLYMAFGHHSWLLGLLYGIKPAVTAIVIQAAFRIGSRALKHRLMWAIAGAAFVAIFVFQLPFPLIVISAALIGYVGGRFVPQQFQGGASHAQSKANHGPAWIDDDSPQAAHTRFSPWRLAWVLAVGALLWLLPMSLLWFVYGWQGQLTQMAWFFSKAALLTFGGAYAVLPYVYQGAVLQYGWLSPLQMMDGLALGETTPGPLIMVVAFVGFVGGYAGQGFAGGALAACVVTWFTFLPSFIFILAGGPLVEATRDDLKFTAPLTAITAAVVGVIVNLALFFAYHTLWPEGLAGAVDLVAAAIAAVAVLALFYFKRGVIEVIGLCGLLGLGARGLV